MFDTMPSPPPVTRNGRYASHPVERVRRTVTEYDSGRRQEEFHFAYGVADSLDDGQSPKLDLIVQWDNALEELCDKVELVSDWGPFECVGVMPLPVNTTEAKLYLCRFFYHGVPKERAHFEENLRALLNGFAVCVDAKVIEEYA